MVSAVLRSFTLPTFAVAVAWALFVAGGSAQGQASTGTYGGAISLGGHGWSSFEAVPVPSGREANQFELSFRGGFATDYIYRGTTLSDHKPAVGAAVEATFGQLLCCRSGCERQAANPGVCRGDDERRSSLISV
jgi:hypothetical protein